MTSDRAAAYGRVMTTIDELGSTKFQPAEIERLREAADTLLFAESFAAPGAEAAIDDVEQLVQHLVDSGRWTAERANTLLDDVQECGPLATIAS
jgi:hypothetical protein